jgi:homoserine dehydrogenase
MVSVIGTTGTGFLQNDACWRELPFLDPGELRSPYYLRVEVEDRPGVLALVAEGLAAHGVSIARLTQHLLEDGAALDVVTHTAAAGKVTAALDDVSALGAVRGRPAALRVISDRLT